MCIRRIYKEKKSTKCKYYYYYYWSFSNKLFLKIKPLKKKKKLSLSKKKKKKKKKKKLQSKQFLQESSKNHLIVARTIKLYNTQWHNNNELWFDFLFLFAVFYLLYFYLFVFAVLYLLYFYLFLFAVFFLIVARTTKWYNNNCWVTSCFCETATTK